MLDFVSPYINNVHVLGSSILAHSFRVQSILVDSVASGSTVRQSIMAADACGRGCSHYVRQEAERKRMQEEARAKS